MLIDNIISQMPEKCHAEIHLIVNAVEYTHTNIGYKFWPV